MSPNPPTAFFCGNDLIALGAYEAVREMGLRIPQDISIVGYDDQEIASYIQPPLSTIRLPYYEMGYQAVVHLLRIVNKQETTKPFQKKLAGVVMERGSIAPTLPR
jgi:LacI family transcriptional regulator